MSKLTNQSITKKELEVFTKEELIYIILRCSWGNLWNPLEVIYQKRMDNNFQKSREIGEEIKKLIDKMKDKDYEELYQISLEIDKLNKIRDKLIKENGRIMKILYGD